MDFSPKDFVDLHVFSRDCSSLFEDWVAREQYATRYMGAMESWDEICNTVPHAWWHLDDELTLPTDFDLGALQRQLRDCRGDAFWNLT